MTNRQAFLYWADPASSAGMPWLHLCAWARVSSLVPADPEKSARNFQLPPPTVRNAEYGWRLTSNPLIGSTRLRTLTLF